jgi:hypothetical protein
MRHKLAELVGWYRKIAIVGAYALVSFNVISSSSATYQILNLTGAMGIIVISTIKKVRQSVVLNTFWAIIAAIALIQLAIHH